MADSRAVVLVTGCTTGGIGHALAKEFQHKGCKVIATTRNPATMQDLVDDPDIITLPLDVCNPESIRSAREQVSSLTGGHLHVLVNNAGGSDFLGAAIDMSMEDVHNIYDLNFFSALRVTGEFMPLLMRAGRSKSAHIVNIGSLAGECGTPYVSIYGAAKAALKSYGDTLRIELAPFNITVTTVITGVVANSKASDYMKLKYMPNSPYKYIADIFDTTFAKINGPATRMPVDQYARAVVRETLKVHPCAHLYAGHLSWLGWFSATFFPLRLLDWIASKVWGFDKLKRHLQTTQTTDPDS